MMTQVIGSLLLRCEDETMMDNMIFCLDLLMTLSLFLTTNETKTVHVSPSQCGLGMWRKTTVAIIFEILREERTKGKDHLADEEESRMVQGLER